MKLDQVKNEEDATSTYGNITDHTGISLHVPILPRNDQNEMRKQSHSNSQTHEQISYDIEKLQDQNQNQDKNQSDMDADADTNANNPDQEYEELLRKDRVVSIASELQDLPPRNIPLDSVPWCLFITHPATLALFLQSWCFVSHFIIAVYSV